MAPNTNIPFRRLQKLESHIPNMIKKANFLSAKVKHIPQLRKRKLDGFIDNITKQRQFGRRVPKLKTKYSLAKFTKSTILKKIRGHTHSAYCVAMAGKWVVSGADDHVVKMWNANTGLLWGTLRGHANVISDICMDLDRGRIVSASEDGLLRVWDVTTRQALHVFKGHTLGVGRIVIDPASGKIASLSDDGTARVWNCNDPSKPALVLPHVDDKLVPVTSLICLSVHPSVGYLVTGDGDGVVRIWNMHDDPNQMCKPIMVMKDHISIVNGVNWSNQGDRILSFSEEDGFCCVHSWRDEVVRVNVAEGEEEKEVDIHEKVKCKPDHITLAADQYQVSRPGKKPKMDAAIFSRDDRYVVSSQGLKSPATRYVGDEHFFPDQQLRVWDSKTGKLVHKLRGHRSRVFEMEAHPWNQRVVVSGGHDGQIIFWDIWAGVELSRVQCMSVRGPERILDLSFQCPSNSIVDVVATDSLGQVYMVGTGAGDEFNSAPPEQFFTTDYAELTYDGNRNAMDSATNLPPHLCPAPLLMRYPVVNNQQEVCCSCYILNGNLFGTLLHLLQIISNPLLPPTNQLCIAL